MFRSRRAAVAPVIPTDDYKVLASFAHRHILQDVGTILSLTEAEAKYHLMANRVAPVEDAAPAVAPVVAPVATPTPAPVAAPVAATVESKPVDSKPADSKPASDSSKN